MYIFTTELPTFYSHQGIWKWYIIHGLCHTLPSNFESTFD